MSTSEGLPANQEPFKYGDVAPYIIDTNAENEGQRRHKAHAFS